ncbi:MAG: aminopeptidase [Pseudohongiellaceae bacterium]
MTKLRRPLGIAARGWKLWLAVLVAVTLVSCRAIGFYGQAIQGQLSILWNREPIEELLNRPDTPPGLRDKLETVMAIREFAERELFLPVAGQYLGYVHLDRPHVVWNVFAAQEFSVKPLNWCYPVAGCASYQGYFSEAGAGSFASTLQNKGYDVYIGGVDAYSTLGWFDDAVLSTVIERSDHGLAALIFHELAHQLVYAPGDTTFNESFATLVEREGVRRWLQARGEPGVVLEIELNSIRQKQFVDLVTRYRDRFAALYESGADMATLRREKLHLQKAMRAEYRSLKATQWNGYKGYDRWFAGPLNNAQLATVTSYNDLVPGFEALLAGGDGDLSRFYEEVVKLARRGKEQRRLELRGSLTAF